LRARWRTIAGVALGFVGAYHALLLAVLVLRFGDWPNYATLHDWPRNVARIVRATPSVADMPPIILDEWLLEIGYLNHDYGLGIAEWSLTILPAKLVLVAVTGVLLGVNIVLLQVAPARRCDGHPPQGTRLAVGGGTALAALACTSMTWVVCCASPSWAVALAMLGVGVSTALWLEPLGVWLQAAGFALLVLSAWTLRRRLPPEPVRPVAQARLAAAPTD
jgi:hypothetical protein